MEAKAELTYLEFLKTFHLYTYSLHENMLYIEDDNQKLKLVFIEQDENKSLYMSVNIILAYISGQDNMWYKKTEENE